MARQRQLTNSEKNQVTNSKLSNTTKIGNIALSKGMYIALMKRRANKTFGEPSSSLASSPVKPFGRPELFKNLSSVRIKTSKMALESRISSRNLYEVSKRITQPKFHLNQHLSPQNSKIRNNSSRLNKKKQASSQNSNLLFSGGSNSNSARSGGGGALSSVRGSSGGGLVKKEQNPLSDITAQVSNVQKHLDFSPLSDEKDKSHQKEDPQPTQPWHQISNNTRVVHTNFFSTQNRTLNSPSQNSNANSNNGANRKIQSPQQMFVPGYEIKFITPKQEIYSFNCFREQDLKIQQQFSTLISVNVDNDCPTDDQQVNLAVQNIFYSLCVAIHDQRGVKDQRSSQPQK